MDWRTQKPIIWRAVPQWFASVEKIRQQILDQIDTVGFSPVWGQKRLHNMIEGRGDWVISRQRVWGVPLPIFYNEDGSAILDADVIEHVAQLFEEHGSSYWFDHEAKELLPEGYTNEASPNGNFTKENDIMDVWFDSGSSWNGVMQYRNELEYPADLYLEGSDQYRGWFNSSLITSVSANGIAPYKNVLSQGFVLDGQGNKMSKSLGNIISPNEVATSMGSEITRLWVLSVDSENDVRVSMDILKQISESYRKIRNTMRFLLANTSDFDPKENSVATSDLTALDFYMHEKFNAFVVDWKNKFDKYQFKDLYQQLTNFINVDLSAFYLDVAKDIVYIEGRDSLTRRSMQTVFYEVLLGLTKLLTPVLPHTTEEIWELLPEVEDFAYLSEMPETEAVNTVLLDKWAKFFELRDILNKELEVARQNEVIGKNAEAEMNLVLTDEYNDLVNELGIDLRQVMMVSYLNLSTGEELSVEVVRAHGQVDPRDRLYHDDLGADSDLPMFSKKNAEIVKKDFPEVLTEGIEE
jgi:isoleucyl-tRNA synthetase